MRVPVRRTPEEPADGGEFGRMRDRLLADLDRWPALVAQSSLPQRPPASVEETVGGWVVAVDLPGVPAGDVDVEIRPGQLVVTARRPGHHHVVPERSGTARRLRLDLTLPPDVDADAVTAQLELGVLRLRLPRSPAPRRRVPVVRRQP